MIANKPVGAFDVRIERQSGYEFRVVFDKPTHAPLQIDEPPPLGGDLGPNPARVLAAAIGSCLAASLAFCLNRAEIPLAGLSAKVHTDLVRNERKRLRIGGVRVELHPEVAGGTGDPAGCLEQFEDFCVVTESVRNGIPVDVSVCFEQAKPPGARADDSEPGASA